MSRGLEGRETEATGSFRSYTTTPPSHPGLVRETSLCFPFKLFYKLKLFLQFLMGSQKLEILVGRGYGLDEEIVRGQKTWEERVAQGKEKIGKRRREYLVFS